MSDPRRVAFETLSEETATSQAAAAMLLHIASLAQSRGYADGLKPSQWTALRYFVGAEHGARTVSAFAPGADVGGDKAAGARSDAVFRQRD